MKRVSRVAAFAAAVVFVAVACTDRRPDSGVPTAPKLVRDAQGQVVMGACTTIQNLNGLAQIIFASNGPNVNSVLGKLNNLQSRVTANDVVNAQAQANNIVSFVQQKAAQGQVSGTKAQVDAFINGVLCFAGLSPDTHLIMPSDTAQTLFASDGQSGVKLPPAPVGVPTLLTFTTLDPNGPSPLITKLDQYPAYVDLHLTSPLVGNAVVAVCPAVSVPSDVRGRLRLGHQASYGFEVTPAADGSFLTCSSSTASASRVPAWIRTVASLVMPKPLYAWQFGPGAGIGGTVTEMSPFDAVDPMLAFGGGIGGTVTELNRKPVGGGGTTDSTVAGKKATTQTATGGTKGGAVASVPRTGANLVSGVCTDVSATVGTALDPSCRPTVTLTTHNGTIMQNVPVDWAVKPGSGTIAPDTVATQGCAAYGATASTLTDALGKAAICWILGPNGGANEATATPRAGGDAPVGVTFSPAILYFYANGIKITPTATATGGPFTFDNQQHPGSGTCSNGLTPALTYSGDGSVPQAAGTYTLTVTCGAGSTVYNTVTATATISIAVVTPAIAFSCPATVVYTGAAQTPCTATATAPGLSLTPTPTYSANIDAGTATATVTLAASGSYGAASGSTTFTITPAATVTTVTCGAGPFTYDGTPQTPCTATTTGPGGLNAPTTVTYAGNVAAGTATATATYAATNNYLTSSGSKTFVIGQASSTTTVTCTPASAAYTGSAQTPCAATATGAGGLNQSLTPTYTNNVAVGTATASASFAGDANHTASSGTATFAITPAATTTTVTCSPASVTYNGAAQSPCSATVTGPGGLNQAVAVTYGDNVNAGPVTATATFAGGGNYLTSTGTASFTILPSPTTTTVSCPAGPYTYSGAPITPCAAAVTGPGGLSSPVPVTYAGNVNAGIANVSASYPGSGNYGASIGSASFTISPAASATAINCPASVTYNGSAQAACTASVTGAGGLNQPVGVTYANNTAAGTASASASFAGDGNHTASSATTTFLINKAASTVTVSCTNTTFTGNAQSPCTASVSGVGGLSGTLPVTYANNVNAGSASASATYAGGANWNGSTFTANFTIAAAATSVAVTCSNVAYNAATQNPCTATVSGPQLSAPATVTYSPSSPRNAGAYTATGSFTGGGNYLGSTFTASFLVTQDPATATAGNATINFGAAVPTIPCAVSGLLAADAGAVTCTTSVPPITIAGTYTTTPVVSPASPVNYAVTPVTGTLTVAAYVQVGCFSSPVYNVMPDSKSAQRKGSNLPVKCTLQTPQGVAVMNATGNLAVYDAGTSAVSPPVRPTAGQLPVWSGTNVFKVSSGGNYAYGLDTSPAGFVAGRWYYVIATWNDGSKTEGWFALK